MDCQCQRNDETIEKYFEIKRMITPTKSANIKINVLKVLPLPKCNRQQYKK